MKKSREVTAAASGAGIQLPCIGEEEGDGELAENWEFHKGKQCRRASLPLSPSTLQSAQLNSFEALYNVDGNLDSTNKAKLDSSIQPPPWEIPIPNHRSC